jgi:colanic acid/amylovoran biosynthesis glycosyltransferase
VRRSASARPLSRLAGLRLHSALRRRVLAGFLRERQVDVALAEFGQTGVLLHEACEEAGVPLVVHFHGYDAYRRPVVAHWGEGYRRVFAGAAAVVAVSHPMEEQLVRLGAPREKLRYNPCGADCDRFRPTDPSANPPRFAAVGRFVPKKAPDLTVRAFCEMRRDCPEARLVMAGEGPLLPTCRKLAGELGIAEGVEFTGNLSHEEVARLMAGARALVQHSVTAPDGNSEGNPVCVMEAGAAGLPVVATRHAGIPEVVVDGETGLLVDEHDVAGMAEKMLALARDPALAARLGRAARERVVAEFSLDGSIARLHEILLEAAGRR